MVWFTVDCLDVQKPYEQHFEALSLAPSFPVKQKNVWENLRWVPKTKQYNEKRKEDRPRSPMVNEKRPCPSNRGWIVAFLNSVFRLVSDAFGFLYVKLVVKIVKERRTINSPRVSCLFLQDQGYKRFRSLVLDISSFRIQNPF